MILASHVPTAARAFAALAAIVACGPAVAGASPGSDKAAPSAAKAASGASGDASPAIPSDLPKDSAPEDYGCDYRRPERTSDPCIRWALYLAMFRREAWDRVSLDLLRRMCRAGDAQGCARAANFVTHGDPAEEQRLRDEACRLGATDECGVDVAGRIGHERARRDLLLRECGDGNGESCQEYGARLWDEDENPAGLEFFEKACRLGARYGCDRADMARAALSGECPW